MSWMAAYDDDSKNNFAKSNCRCREPGHLGPIKASCFGRVFEITGAAG